MMRLLRGAIGMGLTWALAWFGAGLKARPAADRRFRDDDQSDPRHIRANASTSQTFTGWTQSKPDEDSSDVSFTEGSPMRTVPSGSVMLFLGALAACAPAEDGDSSESGPCMLPAEDIAWIRNMEAEHEAQAAAAEFDAMARYVHEDVVIFASNQPPVVGKSTVREWQRQFEGVPFDSYDLTVDEILGCGDLAYVQGTYSMSMTPEGATDPYFDTGIWTHVLRRDPDGTWMIFRDAIISEMPLPAGR